MPPGPAGMFAPPRDSLAGNQFFCILAVHKPRRIRLSNWHSWVIFTKDIIPCITPHDFETANAVMALGHLIQVLGPVGRAA
jgi:hypothetical protein